MNTFPETDISSLDPKNRQQIISMARELLKGGNPGILSTVDQSGFPQSRWMATMSFDDFPDLYTLTSATSRKVAQIQEHPIVHWMFSNQDLSFVVNLTRKGRNLLARSGRDEADLAANCRQVARLFSRRLCERSRLCRNSHEG